MEPSVATIETVESSLLPCPNCDYDLRGQRVPRCPECGVFFSSFDDLRLASANAQRVFMRAMYWRRKLAYAYAVSFVVPLPLLLLLGAYVRAPGLMAILVLVGFSGILLCGLAALVLLAQVLRWRLSRRIARDQRRELNGTIPLLLIYSFPFLLFAVPGLLSLLL